MQNDILPTGPNKNQPKPSAKPNLDDSRDRLSGLRGLETSEMATGDIETINGMDIDPPQLPANRPKNGSKSHRWKFWHDWSRRRKIAYIFISLIVIALIGANIYYYLQSQKPSEVDEVQLVKMEPKVAPSPLTGVKVPIELTKRPVTAVMIENSLSARPQSGLREAGVVFEAIAEGGITRYIVLFQDSTPQYVGPVRSLRPYYIDFAAPFQAGIAHVGGSPDALKQIRGEKGLRDLDQFFNAGAYWRISSRAAPHNVYTNFKNLDALNKSKSYKESKFMPWLRKSDKKSETPTATTINVKISGPLYDSKFTYDSKTNSYLRFLGGQPHNSTTSEKDKGGKQINPKTVIALVMNRSIAGSGHSVYTASGKGQMFVFQDGQVIKGTWSKKNRTSQFEFTDSEGKPIRLNRGQSWVTIVSATSQVSYTAPKPKPAQ